MNGKIVNVIVTSSYSFSRITRRFSILDTGCKLPLRNVHKTFWDGCAYTGVGAPAFAIRRCIRGIMVAIMDLICEYTEQFAGDGYTLNKRLQFF